MSPFSSDRTWATRIKTAAAIAAALGVELRDLFTTGARTDQEKRRQELSRVILKLVEQGDDEALEAISEVVNSILKLRRNSPRRLPVRHHHPQLVAYQYKCHEWGLRQHVLEIRVARFPRRRVTGEGDGWGPTEQAIFLISIRARVDKRRYTI